MDIDDLLPQLLPEVSGCPSAIARNAIRNAAIEFCRDTHAWNLIQDPTTLIDLQHTYDIDVPEDAKVAAVLAIWDAVDKLRSKTMSEIEEALPDWQTARSPRPLYFNSSSGDGTVRLFPTPYLSQRARVTMRVAFVPTRTATTLDDDMVEDNFEVLMAGAKARLMAMPGAWANPQLAAFNGGRFEAGKVDARIKVLHEGVVGSLYAKPRRFGLS